MDAGTIVTISGIAVLIIIHLISFIYRRGKENQRLKSVEKVVFEDGLVEKVNELKVTVARMEGNVNVLVQRSNPGSFTEPQSDKLR